MTLLLLLLLVPSLLIAGAVYQMIGSWVDRARFPPPGRLVEVGGCSLHVQQQGSGKPLVVLEAGIAATSISWLPVQTLLAPFSTVCSYDRAGLGWSQPRVPSRPRTLENMVAELEILLRNGQFDRPFLLVGHSFGGLLVRAFAHTYPEQVAGLVLVDPVSLAWWGRASQGKTHQIAAGARLSRRGAVLARIGLVRAALSALSAGRRWLPEHLGRAAAREGRDLMQNLAREVARLPPDLQSVVRAHWSRPQGFLAMAEYLEVLPACAAAGLMMRIPPRIPVTIISAGNATAAELGEREAWAAESERGCHLKVPGTGHWLQLERPELISDAVREMATDWRVRCTAPGHGI